MDRTTRLRRSLAVCLVIAGLCSTCLGRVIYVDDDATGRADGSSWVDAYPYLQDALAAAGEGDEVRVAQGTYRPNQGVSVQPSPVPDPRRSVTAQATDPAGQDLVFTLIDGVAILGGFAGLGAADPNARDAKGYETILSGDLAGNDEDNWGPEHPITQGLRADNSHYVVKSQATDSTAVLDGCVIERATSAGMCSEVGSLRIVDCTFRDNHRRNASGAGGGLYCHGGKLTLLGCTFQGNSTDSNGGGIYGYGRLSLTLSQCRFAGNWASGTGGAISCPEGGLVLSDCVFESNAAQRGGAIYHGGSSLTLADCTFEDNAVGDAGGAVFVAGGSMTGCVFRRNWAINSGGAAYNEAKPLVMTLCTLTGNSATAGGALFAVGQVAIDRAVRHVTMTQCLLAGNRATTGGAGGALFSNAANFTITGCTFAGNWAPRGNTLEWVMSATTWEDNVNRVNMDNCIVWDGNEPISVYLGPRANQPVPRPTPRDTVVAAHSDIQGGWPGLGDIDTDPLFAAPGHWVDAGDPRSVVDGGYTYAAWVDGDYHLKSQAGRWDPQAETWVMDDVTSPCIDAGDPNTPVGGEPVPNGGRINMGAYGGTAEASMSPAGG